MSELERLCRLLHNAHDGDPWHGSSRSEVLDGLTASDAAARPLASGHSIWEIVLHSTAWAREVTRRLRGADPEPPEFGDWPPAPSVPDDAAWAAALDDLDHTHHELCAAVLSFDPARLEEMVGAARNQSLGTGVTWYEMLHGLVHHEIYHSGQISMLKQELNRSRRPIR